MAENRYGGGYRREGWRESEGSIFSDDDDRRVGSGRWSGDYGRERGGGRDDDRGFFERAGDEVRSWFGDDEAERRREMDTRRDEARSAFSGDEDRQRGGRDYGRRHEGGSTGPTGGYGSSWESRSEQGRSDWRSGGDRERGFGSGSGISGGFGGSAGMGSRFESRGGSRDQGRHGSGGGRSPWDENYQRWRSQQLEQFDREYDDYCRERQRQFDQDFDSWRTSRLTEGGTGGGMQTGGSSGGTTMQTGGGSATGYSGDASRSQGSAGATSGSLGSEGAGTTTGGGGTGSATQSSTGSTGAQAAGRGRRSRT